MAFANVAATAYSGDAACAPVASSLGPGPCALSRAARRRLRRLRALVRTTAVFSRLQLLSMRPASQLPYREPASDSILRVDSPYIVVPLQTSLTVGDPETTTSAVLRYLADASPYQVPVDLFSGSGGDACATDDFVCMYCTAFLLLTPLCHLTACWYASVAMPFSSLTTVWKNSIRKDMLLHFVQFSKKLATPITLCAN